MHASCCCKMQDLPYMTYMAKANRKWILVRKDRQINNETSRLTFLSCYSNDAAEYGGTYSVYAAVASHRSNHRRFKVEPGSKCHIQIP